MSHTVGHRWRLREVMATRGMSATTGDLACQLPERRPAAWRAPRRRRALLVPGRQPDRPLHPASLRHRFTALRPDARTARDTALLQLAAELSIPVVADLLDLHVVTAAIRAEQANAAHARHAAIHVIH